MAEEADESAKESSASFRRGVKDWREERESQQLKKRVEEIKIAGRPRGGAATRVGFGARDAPRCG